MALPNGPMEIVFSFDTTGSMHGCLVEVRGRVSDMVQRLQADIPGIRIAVFAHGDYCDRNSTYLTKFVDFTNDAVKLCDFVNTVGATGGGDSDECYELVLNEVRTKLSWTPGSQRALVMIGDCNPHEPNYPQNKRKIDWRKEADSLGAMGVRIYSVQCKDYADSTKFYQDIARRTSGHHLKLNDFKNVFDFLMAVCYREKDSDMLNVYEKEVRARGGGVHKDLDVLFSGLRDGAETAAGPSGAPAPSTIKVKKPKKVVSMKGSVKKELKSDRKMVKVKRAKRVYVPAKLQRYVDKNLPRLRRENVPEYNFALNNMSWSKWQLAMCPSAMDDSFRKRHGASACGFRKRTIFNGRTKLPALYEVAVQTKCRTRKYVVYSKCCRIGFMKSSNWEKHLLGRSDTRAQIDDVLAKNCSVFIRRVLLKGRDVLTNSKQSLAKYDYAWKVVPSERKCHRNVTKGSVDISSAMEVDS